MPDEKHYCIHEEDWGRVNAMITSPWKLLALVLTIIVILTGIFGGQVSAINKSNADLRDKFEEKSRMDENRLTRIETKLDTLIARGEK